MVKVKNIIAYSQIGLSYLYHSLGYQWLVGYFEFGRCLYIVSAKNLALAHCSIGGSLLSI